MLAASCVEGKWRKRQNVEQIGRKYTRHSVTIFESLASLSSQLDFSSLTFSGQGEQIGRKGAYSILERGTPSLPPSIYSWIPLAYNPTSFLLFVMCAVPPPFSYTMFPANSLRPSRAQEWHWTCRKELKEDLHVTYCIKTQRNNISRCWL